MKRPEQWPNTPYAAFVDGIGPSIDSGYLNQNQEGMSDLAGMLFQRSATLVTDEFVQLTYPVGYFGSLVTFAGFNYTYNWRVPTASNQHGVWATFATANGAYSNVLVDAMYWIGLKDYTFSVRACVDNRAALDTLFGNGFVIGINDSSILSETVFVAGTDQPNWHVRIAATSLDTGVPIVDGRFYDLQIARIDQIAYVYIDGALRLTVAYPDDLRQATRIVRVNSPAMAINQGAALDYFRLAIMR